VAPGPDFSSFALGVEVVPPAGGDPGPLLARLEAIASPEVAGFSVATNPLARPGMSALALSALIQERTGKPATMHCTTRDHNRLSLQSLLWGARALGIDSVLVATGDYVALGDRARTTTVRDVNVFELVALARKAGLHVGVVLDPRPGPAPLEIPALEPGGARAPDLDSLQAPSRGGRDAPGSETAPGTRAASVEEGPGGSHLAYQVRRLGKKIEAGAQYVVTQPVYDEPGARELREATVHLPVPVVLGILPLRSARHGRFLHERVAGISVPAGVVQRLEATSAAGGDPAAEGIALAAEMLALARRWFAGALLMPPFGHYEVVGRILEKAYVPL
jgi:homocysteine S-methyltransferase